MYEAIQERLDFEEAKLADLLEQTKATRARITDLKVELAKLHKEDPESLVRTKKSDSLPLVEVRDEKNVEALIFTNGEMTKLKLKRKTSDPE